uniref:Uncharacterized protein n=1 Tax=Zooxanthella nutricula TaxID=1333877 RepID=A0A7S2M643_9DINO|mmetsp:Transcript_71549/g.219178  ORF Transcript_71549/g.219178 Transcript_71549/m.219178 type:complete len:166 (+) Transcript_71549:2-499(+)
MKFWERQPRVTGMPILIFADRNETSKRFGPDDVVQFAATLANRTNAQLAVVGIGQESWESLTAKGMVPPHFRRFDKTGEAIDELKKDMVLGDFSKFLVATCGPYAGDHGDIGHPFVLDYILDADCGKSWHGVQRRYLSHVGTGERDAVQEFMELAWRFFNKGEWQ